jgi:5'-3' exonuclease
MTKPRTLLVDADIVAFKASSATQGTWFFNGKDEEPAIEADLEGSLKKAEKEIESIANKLKATKIIVCLTDDHNFRLDVWEGYKGNRKDVRKPVHLGDVKDFFKRRYETYQRPGLEADDCMGILSTHPTLLPGEKIIVSEDKDMKTIPGMLFNPRKHEAPVRVSQLEADRFFMWQTIVGDSTDGYPGAKGVGPRSRFAQDVLEAPDLKGMWAIVLEAYASKGLEPAKALEQARMARILRASDWDFNAKRPRLWQAPF